jgi:hypothetical protein
MPNLVLSVGVGPLAVIITPLMKSAGEVSIPASAKGLSSGKIYTEERVSIAQ